MTTATDLDLHWMRRALELARNGIGVTSPNPAVGCVILDAAGQLIGEGWHEYDKLDHAEIVALQAAESSTLSANDAERMGHGKADRGDDRIRGGTAYVTLEPCCTTGRTPPCTDALIQAGLARVVAATIDPNPAVAGRGLQALHAAGLRTSVGVCEQEARRLN